MPRTRRPKPCRSSQFAKARHGAAGSPPVPASVVGNTDPDVQQLFGFAQDTAIDLVDRWDWTNLKVQFQIVGDGVTTIFGLPPDWQRICPSDKSPMGALISSSRPTLPLIGPVNDEWLNAQKALPAALPMPVWRQDRQRS
jgi:hypothetical protein